MKKILFTFTIVVYSIVLNSQDVIKIKKDSTLMYSSNINSYEHNIEKYILTYSGNLLTGNDFQIINNNDSIFFQIDSLGISLSSIKFVKYGDNFWANTNNFHFDGKNDFALRTDTGKINLYQRIEFRKNITYNDISLAMNQIYGYSTKTIDTEVIDYYNKDFEDLKIVKYRNLLNDLSDNPNSLSYLNKYKTNQIGISMFYITGIASIIYGISNQFSASDKEHRTTKISTYLPIGFGLTCAWHGSKLSKKNSRFLRKAIEIY